MLDDSSDASLSREDVVAVLARTEIFSSLGENWLHDLAERGHLERFLSGDRLIQQGDMSDCAYLILRGGVTIEVETPEGRVSVAEVNAGEIVGEIAAFAAMPRTASVVSKARTETLRIDHSTIKAFLRDAPETAMSIIAELGMRIQSINGVIASLKQAANALAEDEFKPEMLRSIRDNAGRFSHFADVFEHMAEEISSKRLRQHEMQTAAEIQRSFLPQGLDAGQYADKFEIFADMIPAKSVGGDFFDYFMIGENKLGFAVGDVSGKGVPAAMFMSVSRTVLKTKGRDGGPADQIMADVNNLLSEDNTEGMFVTIAFAILNLDTGMLNFTSAAHEEAYILSASGELEKISPMGPAIGLFGGVGFRSGERQLQAGDTVVFATDGVSEAFAPDRRQFGMGRMEESLRRNPARAAEAFVRDLQTEVHDFAAEEPQSDDLTCLAMKYLG